MKNKFKKSKIIVPALALITATTVASVTGTVAWFTASRAVTVNASTFIATKLESALNVTCEGRIGTAATTDKKGITTTTETNTSNLLTHGSYDAQAHANGSLYVADVNDDGETIDSFSDLGNETTAKSSTASTTANKWLARTGTNQNIWYGVSWTMTFSLEAETTNTTDYLFIDVAGSSFTNSATTSTDPTTMPGFRIAFMTSSKCLVLGGDDVKTHVDASTTLYTKADTSEGKTPDSDTVYYTKNGSDYTSAGKLTSFTSGTEYYTKTPTYSSFGDNDYVAISDTTAKVTDVNETDSLSSNKFNLGKVGTATGNSLTITCVAWYEGSDPYVMNTNNNTDVNMSEVTASLNFYTRAYRQ